MHTVPKALIGAGIALVFAFDSAWALNPPIEIPEPSALGIFAAGGVTVLGVYVVKRFFTRK